MRSRWAERRRRARQSLTSECSVSLLVSVSEHALCSLYLRDWEVELEEGGEGGAEPVVATGKKGKGKKKKGFADL